MTIKLCFSYIRLEKLQALDEAKIANEKAKNALESHIFAVRENIDSELGEKLSTEDEREMMSQSLSQASDWLDDEGWDTTANVSRDRQRERHTNR